MFRKEPAKHISNDFTFVSKPAILHFRRKRHKYDCHVTSRARHVIIAVYLHTHNACFHTVTLLFHIITDIVDLLLVNFVCFWGCF